MQIAQNLSLRGSLNYMTPFEAYQKYIALKNHFNTSYDYHKYNGKVKVNESSYETRRDKYFFMKLSKRKDVEKYLLANFVEANGDFYVGNIRNQSPDDVYLKWKKRQESLTYTFKEDLSKMDDDFDSNFKVDKYGHPLLLRLFLRKDICMETMIILDMLTDYTKLWNKKLVGDVIWEEKYGIINKYRSFLSIDTDKYKSIVIEYFE